MIIRMHWDSVIHDKGEMKFLSNELGSSAIVDCGKGAHKAQYSIKDRGDGSLEIRAVQWGKSSSPRIVVLPEVGNSIQVRGERIG